jgi:hypothetical protein
VATRYERPLFAMGAGGSMYFIPTLSCHGCGRLIRFPLTLQGEFAPRHIAWPWGALSANFLCESCLKISSYWAEDCNWEESDDHPTGGISLFQVDIKCGATPCIGTLPILTTMPPGSYVAEAAERLASADMNGIPCNVGQHPNIGRRKDMCPGSIAVTLLTEMWE